MATHRYWRVTITESTSGADNLVSLYEAEMRGVAAGSDLCNGGTASASHNDSTVYKLFDNNNSLHWSNGGPSATCWFQYDFSGGDVEIKQLWFLPRYSYQSPKNFTLSSSDNGTTWNEEAAWSNITDWSGGVEKALALPGPIASKKNSQQFALTLSIQNQHPAEIGVFAKSSLSAPFSAPAIKQSSQPYPIIIEHENLLPYSPSVTAANQHIYGLTVNSANQQTWQRWLMGHSTQPMYAELNQPNTQEWSLRTKVEAQNEKPFSQTYPIAGESNHPCDLLLRNPVKQTKHCYWDLADDIGWRQVSMPEIKVDGLPMALTSLTIKASQDHFGWQAELTLADESSWQALILDQPFTLEIAGEIFALIVDSKNSVRDGTGKHVRTVAAISPIAQYAAPRAIATDGEWEESAGAKDIVEKLLNSTVQWQLVDWPITAGRLNYKHQTPMETAHSIVSATGGVINSQADGSVLVQPRFPIPVPDWNQATPNHIFTDSADNLAIRESSQAQIQFDRITVRNSDPSLETGFLAIDIDQREQNPNLGKTHFQPGETTHLLLTAGPGIEPATITPSTANIIATGEISYPVTQQLAFINNNQAKLPRPIRQVEQYNWLGSDLGVPLLAADGQTITTPIKGTAILQISGNIKSYGYQFKAPNQLEGQKSFPVAFSSWGAIGPESAESASKQRNNGSKPALDIIAPLLGNKLALQARCEQELNRGEALQNIEITTLYRPELAPGQLIEVHDALYGRTFRGLLSALCHEINHNGPTSKLTIKKNRSATVS